MAVNCVNVEVITPSKVFYQGSAQLVIVRTLEGDEGYMKGHAWACKLLDISELRIQEEGADKNEFKIAAISRGFIEVKENIVIYTDAAEWPEDIDLDRVAHEKQNAEDWLAANEATASPKDIQSAKDAIKKAAVRTAVANHGKDAHMR